jgi:ATP-dependent RNA helicase RhlE
MLFQDLKLIEPLLKALKEEGYVTPTPIQVKAIPIVLNGTDLLACAQTGTGKTAAFVLPILQKLFNQESSRRNIKALILTPTRELAIQIDESIKAYGRYSKIKHTVIFGGVGQGNQVNSLQRGVDILTATPGRLLDLINQGFVDLKNLDFFVLDEADRMLDMGFIHDVKKIISKIPKVRQTLFFSATMPPEIQKLSDTLLTNPQMVAVTPPASTVDKIDQNLYFVSKTDKPSLLIHLLESENIPNAIVFTRTKHGANKVVKVLLNQGISSAAIHGNKSQTARQNALSDFKTGRLRVLVATDIAARGIDIDDLSYVFNYDLPEVSETYVHRIGRTGRAGNTGKAIAFCSEDELVMLRGIEKLIKKTIPVVASHPYASNAKKPAAITPSNRPVQSSASNRQRPVKSASSNRTEQSSFSSNRPAKPFPSTRSEQSVSSNRTEQSSAASTKPDRFNKQKKHHKSSINYRFPLS